MDREIRGEKRLFVPEVCDSKRPERPERVNVQDRMRVDGSQTAICYSLRLWTQLVLHRSLYKGIVVGWRATKPSLLKGLHSPFTRLRRPSAPFKFVYVSYWLIVWTPGDDGITTLPHGEKDQGLCHVLFLKARAKQGVVGWRRDIKYTRCVMFDRVLSRSKEYERGCF